MHLFGFFTFLILFLYLFWSFLHSQQRKINLSEHTFDPTFPHQFIIPKNIFDYIAIVFINVALFSANITLFFELSISLFYIGFAHTSLFIRLPTLSFMEKIKNLVHILKGYPLENGLILISCSHIIYNFIVKKNTSFFHSFFPDLPSSFAFITSYSIFTKVMINNLKLLNIKSKLPPSRYYEFIISILGGVLLHSIFFTQQYLYYYIITLLILYIVILSILYQRKIR